MNFVRERFLPNNNNSAVVKRLQGSIGAFPLLCQKITKILRYPLKYSVR